MDTFFTIASPAEGIFRERGSKFIAFAYPVCSEASVKEKLSFLRKKYFDANHHCYAWRLGVDGGQHRANDDGEPANTAGKPILGQLIAYKLTNVLLVVVRYFGGTLLGTGGLTQAYKRAAATVLDNTQIVQEVVAETYKLTFDYADLNKALKFVKDMNLECVQQDINLDCAMTVKVRKSKVEEMKKRLNTIKVINYSTLNLYLKL